MAVTLGQLRYRLGAADESFRRTMTTAQTQLRGFHDTVQRGATTLRNWGLAAGAAGTAVAYAASRIVNSTAKLAGEIDTVAKQTGVAVESLQGLQYAAQQSGASIQTLESGLRSFARRSAEAARGNEQYLKSFERLGLKQADVAEGLHNMDELLLEVADRIAQLPTTAEQSAVAMDLMSDSGRQLVPMLAQGRDGIQALIQQAERLGIVLTRDNIARFAEYDNTLQRFRAGMSGLRMQLATAILPIFERLARAGTENVSSISEWVRENRTFLLQAVILGTALTTLATGFGVVATGVFLAIRAVGLITGVIGFLLSPVGLVIGAMTLLYAAWSGNWGGMKDAVTSAWETISPILDAIVEWEKRTITTVWNWVIDGLNWMSGTFIPWFVSLPDRMTNTWTWIVNGLADLKEAAALAIERAVTWTVNLVRGIWDTVTDWIDKAVTWTVNLARGVWEAVDGWIDRLVTWTVNLARGVEQAVADWVDRAITWIVSLAGGAWDAVADWIDKAITWTVNLTRGIWQTVAGWVDKVVQWTVNLARGLSDTVADWLSRTITWLVNLARGSAAAINDWISKAIDWTVNLLKGTAAAVSDWVGRVITWVVNLARGAADAVADWIDRAIAWTVNLMRGTAQAVSDWLERAVTWTVNLIKGSYEAVAEWLAGAVTWVVDLAQGRYEAVREWIERVVDWTVNLVRVTADKANAAAQWLLGLIEGRAEAKTITTDVDLDLQEAKPGWGDRLEAWLRKRIEGLQWREISEEEFRRLQEELGEQARDILREENGRYFQATPQRLEMAADFVLNLGNSIAGFAAGRAAYDTLTAAAKALLAGLGWTWGVLSTGVMGWILPALGWTAALGLGIIVATAIASAFMPPEERQSLKDEIQRIWDNEELSLSIKVAKIALEVLEGVWTPLLQDVDDKVFRPIRQMIGSEASEEGKQLQKFLLAPPDIRKEQIGELRERLGETELKAASPWWRSFLNRLGIGRSDSSAPIAPPMKDPTATIEDVVGAVIQAHPHLEKYNDVLADMAERMVAIGEAKDAPMTVEELAEVMALLIKETGTLLDDVDAMGNPLQVTTNGFSELDLAGIKLTETTAGLNRNLEAGLELFRLYKREYGNAALAAGAYTFPGFARRGEFERPFDRPGTDVHGLSVTDIADRYKLILDPMRDAGKRLGITWSEGLIASKPFVEAAADDLALGAARRLIGHSPPPEGPLSEIDNSGIIKTWIKGMLDDIPEEVKTLEDGIKYIADKMYNAMMSFLEEKAPWLAEVFASLFDEDSDFNKALDDLGERLKGLEDNLSSLNDKAIQWTDNLVRGLSDAIAYGRSLTDVFDNFLRMLASRFIETQILGPLFNTFLPGVLGGLPVFHAGGLVLGGAGALVMHDGGLVPALRSDERLIVAQTGERVLSRTQNEKFEEMMSNRSNDTEPREVNVNLLVQAVDAASFVQLAQRNPEAITTVVLGDIMGNGDIRKAVQAVSRGR